jgi:prepilin-type N-terminal cleavage/methylation domain-containing protein
MKATSHGHKGFSLVELVVTILVFGMVIGVIYRLLISSTKSVGRGKMAANIEQNLRVGMDEMLKDIRQAGYGIATLPAFTKAGRTKVAFWADIDNDKPTDLVVYYVGDSTELSDTPNPHDAYLYRRDLTDLAQGSIPIARGVRKLEFQYYDANGVPLLNGSGDDAVVESDTTVADLNGNGVPDINDIRSVEITLTFESETPDPRINYNNGYLQYVLNTRVYPINLELLAKQASSDNLLDLTITPDPAQGILIGDDLQFYATATYEKAGAVDVTTYCFWNSSDTSVAKIGTFIPGSGMENNEGLATGVGPGITRISCMYKGMPSSNSVLLKVGGPETRFVKINGSNTFAMIEGSTNNVLLTAEVNDIGFGSANIVGARYDVPSLSVGNSMAPNDGAFDSPVENVYAVVDITGWTAAGSPYTFYVKGRDADNPFSWGPPETATLVIMASDNLGPVVTNMSASPSLTIPEGTASITITADIDDTPTGGSNIAYAEAFVNTMGPGGSGAPLTPVDGVLDSPLETMTLTLNTSTWMSIDSPYKVYLIGKDVVGNWGDENFIEITVTAADGDGPIVTALTGPGSINAGQAYVTVTGTASDATTGGSNIAAVEGFADSDPGAGNATPMTPTDGAYDSPDEGFTGDISSFPWPVGSNHVIYVRAKDDAGNWGPINSVNVDVKSTVNGKDVVIALANGDFEVWHGDGVGGFKGKDTYNTGVTINDLKLTDIDADGNTDVVVGSSDGMIQVWHNDGFGSLGITPAQELAVGSPVASVVAGDFNVDGSTDIACTTLDGNVLFYANDGTGTLINSNYLTYPGTHLRYMYMSGISDFNGDGFPDLAIAGTTTDMSVHEFQPLLHPGAGGGQWNVQKHNHYTGELAGMAIADFDMDGINDVLLALNDAVTGVQLWSGDGTGKFTQGGLQVWTDEILSISSYDYNKDGVLDVVLGTSGTSAQEIDVILNNGSGIFDTVNPFSADITVPASAISFAFLDQDADIDVVSAGNTAGSLFSFVQLPTNELNQTVNSPFLSGGTAVLLRVGEIGN